MVLNLKKTTLLLLIVSGFLIFVSNIYKLNLTDTDLKSIKKN